MRIKAKNLKKGVIIQPPTKAHIWRVMWTERLTRPMGVLRVHCEAKDFHGVTDYYDYDIDGWVTLAE